MSGPQCGAMGCLGVNICRVSSCPHRTRPDLLGNLSMHQQLELQRALMQDKNQLLAQMAQQQQQMQMQRASMFPPGSLEGLLGMPTHAAEREKINAARREAEQKRGARDRLHLDLCKDFCTCGTPDPLREGHGSACPMVTMDLEIMYEIEKLAPHDVDVQLDKREPSWLAQHGSVVKWVLTWLIIGMVVRILGGLL